MVVEEAMPEESEGAIGFLLSSDAWSRRAEHTSAWLVMARTMVMIQRKQVPVLVLDVKRDKF